MNQVKDLAMLEDSVFFDVALPGGKNLHVVAGGPGHKPLEITVPGTDFGVDINAYFMAPLDGMLSDTLPTVQLYAEKQAGAEGSPVSVVLTGQHVTVYHDEESLLRVEADIKHVRVFSEEETQALSDAITVLRSLKSHDPSWVKRMGEVCEILNTL